MNKKTAVKGLTVTMKRERPTNASVTKTTVFSGPKARLPKRRVGR